MNYTNFNSRETYLDVVAEWKADYKELSQKIRETKKQFNEAQKAFSKSSTKEGTYWPAWKEVERLRSELDTLRVDARNMLADRSDMKSIAQVQYEHSKQIKSTCDYLN